MSKSADLFTKSQEFIPGGVNSPVRAFNAVGGNPPVFKQAKGAYLTDVDGQEYVDFVLSWGPAILGHAPDVVVKAVQEEAENGFSYGMPSALEPELAEFLCHKIKGIDQVRFVSSGTEATMSALRLARGFTGAENIIKFEGCYHGHSDGLLVTAGSGVATFGDASSDGVPEGYTQHTISVPYNDLDAVDEALETHDIAAIILEPVPGNMGVVPPTEEFIQGLRELCDKYETLLIFDEVMCGFRVSDTTAADRFNVYPDLYCFGKVIGGGLPVGAFGGRKEIMEKLAPLGPVYQAGTLSGNPLAMRAGLETLKAYYETDAFATADAQGAKLEEKVKALIADKKELKFTRVGTMFTIFFNSEDQLLSIDDVNECDFERFGRFFQHMLKNGMLIPPSQYEANFLASVHTDEHIEKYIAALTEFIQIEGIK